MDPATPGTRPVPSTFFHSQAAIQHWKQKIAQNRQECEVMGLGSTRMGFEDLKDLKEYLKDQAVNKMSKT